MDALSLSLPKANSDTATNIFSAEGQVALKLCIIMLFRLQSVEIKKILCIEGYKTIKTSRCS